MKYKKHLFRTDKAYELEGGMEKIKVTLKKNPNRTFTKAVNENKIQETRELKSKRRGCLNKTQAIRNQTAERFVRVYNKLSSASKKD